MTISRKSISNNKDWNTPPEYIEIVKNVLGNIELDPCSNDFSMVMADSSYNENIDGLKQNWSWAKTIFVNPPYGRNPQNKTTIKSWILKCIETYKNGNSEIIALIPVATNTKHWYEIFYTASAICFIKTPRVKFYLQGQLVKKGAPMGCAFIYWGFRPDRFRDSFSNLGKIFYE